MQTAVRRVTPVLHRVPMVPSSTSSARMASNRIVPAAHVAIAVVVADAIVEVGISATARARVPQIKAALPPTLHSCRMILCLPLMARRL